MFRRVFWMVVLALLFTGYSSCQADQQLSQILDGIKKRYGQMAGLSVPYQREILTKSMALLGDQMKSDVARGRIFFKPPHFLKVQQETPTPEDLITDGNVLWWYIPQKHQAHRIPSSKLGKELGLLEDVFRGLRGVEESFVVTLVGEDEKGLTLELTPNPPWPDTHHIDLLVNPKGFLIQKVEVYDLMGGVTRFTLGEVTEQKKFKQGFFSFVPPPGVRIIEE